MPAATFSCENKHIIMDDSDQDFVDLYSKLLKRVRKKPGESRQPRKAERPSSSQASQGDKRRKNNKNDGNSGAKVSRTQPVVSGGSGYDSGDPGSSVVASAVAAGPRTDGGLRAKEKVLLKMQQFKRAIPPKMVHEDNSKSTNHENDAAPSAEQQRQDTLESFSSEPRDSDEALALRLQQEMDREAAEAQTVDLEDGGLFFCQICQRDLSHMTPEGRTQHINRCLDESEESGPVPPPPPGVPDCPICGKKFKSQKSRSTHLKRCSSEMGVAPAVLLQAVHRQAEEIQSITTANTLTKTVGTKRKGPSKSGLPARKKPRKKTDPLDEETMVALALSSSLLEREREQQRDNEAARQTEAAASHTSTAPGLKWRPDGGKGRGKRKKGAVPRPPPLLLVQDADSALTRLQERVSALLLQTRSPSPPTPTRCPSTLPGCSGAASLWQKSTLQDGGSTCLSDFYCPELREFFAPTESVTTGAATNRPESSVQPVCERTPVTVSRVSIPPSSSRTASCSSAPSTPGTGQLPVGSQTLQDLLELNEDGTTLTQRGYTDKDEQINAHLSTNLHLSGFIQEESEEHADLCASGFLPESAHTPSEDTRDPETRTTDRPKANEDGGSHQSAALSRLASDLSNMVNNPQLSDVQLQVDSGDVYFAHSFMVYARCPLLAEMVHESGFGVREEGVAAAQRVLISDVPGQAVLVLLQYLYTGCCSIPASSLQPHVLELASRFDLQELQQLCQLRQEEADDVDREENVDNQTGQALMELLRTMWIEGEQDDDRADSDEDGDQGRRSEEDHQTGEVVTGDGEIQEEHVNEEELEEIYEFVATQRKKEEKDTEEEEEEEERVDEEEDGDAVFTKLTEPKSGKNQQPSVGVEPDASLDLSYNRLFSDSWGVYEEGDPSSSACGPPKTQTPPSKHQTPHKPSSDLSGRTLLQSSVSAVEDLSFSPPPSTPTLPVPGVSPAPVGDWGSSGDRREDDVRLKTGNQGPHSICVPLCPNSSIKKEEPELIVLSDSSEEMEMDVPSSYAPSSRSSCTAQNLKDYTEVRSKSIPTPNEPAPEKKQSSSLELSPGDPPDCSPEVSWLIPSTPPAQLSRSTRTSSTQTRSSMCRTQLFPRGDTSPPSSSVFSSPALPVHTPTRSPAEGRVSRLKLNRTSPRSSSLNISPRNSSNSCNVSKDGEVFAAPLSQHKLSNHHHSLQASLKENTPLHPQHKPYSSTPLHTELHQRPDLPAASPLHTAPNEPTGRRRERTPSESPEKTELGSFHLSLADQPSSSSHGGLQSSQRLSNTSSQSRRSVESSCCDDGGVELRMRTRNVEEETEIDCNNGDMADEGEQEEAKGETEGADAAESSFQQSFMAMDEPPLAFNDSWGLDANPGCFSLRLEDSREDSRGQRAAARSPSSPASHPPTSNHGVQMFNGRVGQTTPSPTKGRGPQPSSSGQARTGVSFTPSPPDNDTRTTPEIVNSLLDSRIWDNWEEEEEEEEEEEVLPLSQRVNPSAQLKTPATSHNKRRRMLVPITPMPHYSDMDTPELKNKLNRFGVRPLPKRQMILKLKEIHQYTHQLVSSDSEEEAPRPAGCTAQVKPPPPPPPISSRPVSCTQTVKFKEPRAPAVTSPVKHIRGEDEEEAEPLSASQGSNTSSTAASEESERSNPELCVSSDGDSDSDGGISASQAASRLQDRLQAVRSFILSDTKLYGQILQYQPLVLSQLQQQLKAAGIRLGAAKLVDYLDSQCITFTTAKPGHTAPGRRRGKKAGAVAAKAPNRKKGVTVII